MKRGAWLLVAALSCHAQVRPADPPAGAGSGMPHLAADGGGTLLSWLEPQDGKRHALRWSRWEEGRWTAPATVASGENWFINWVDFPAVLPLEGGAMMAHWLERVGSGKWGYAIQVARFDGREWRRVFTSALPDPEDYSGFLSFVADGPGVGAAYLSPPLEGAAHGNGGHRKTLRYVRFDEGGAVMVDREVDGDVCSCCPTSAVSTGKGILVAYRDHLAGEIRDISVVRLAGGQWSSPRRVHPDGWKIEGCPTEGPSIAAVGNDVAIAWMTRAGDAPRLQMAISRDGGDGFASPVRIDGGNPVGRPSVTVFEKSYLVVWLERAEGGRAELRLRRVFPDGRLSRPVAVATASAARSSGLPKVAVAGGRIMVAWRDGRVRAAVLEAPE